MGKGRGPTLLLSNWTWLTPAVQYRCQYYCLWMPGLQAGSTVSVYARVQCWEPKTGQQKVLLSRKTKYLAHLGVHFYLCFCASHMNACDSHVVKIKPEQSVYLVSKPTQLVIFRIKPKTISYISNGKHVFNVLSWSTIYGEPWLNCMVSTANATSRIRIPSCSTLPNIEHKISHEAAGTIKNAATTTTAIIIILSQVIRNCWDHNKCSNSNNSNYHIS